MKGSLSAITLLVPSYDEAIAYFTETIGFELRCDQDLGNGKRWVQVAPVGSTTCLLLARAVTPEQSACIGRQGGGRVFLFLHSSDFWKDYERMRSAGVFFEETPRHEPYGWVAVFRDLYGNRWDLLEGPSD
jgi:catechol 2,3-dioxygenase-like lactoylglutathione lyase family enzyme